MQKNKFLEKSNPLLWVLLIQAILVVLAFPRFFVSPNDFMFSVWSDAIKNYFTFQAYLQQAQPVGEFRLMQHAYPYGDYLFYADLIPLVAVPLKWFCTYVYDVSAYSVGILNSLFIATQLLIVWPIYRLFSRFLKTPWLLVVLTISLAWIHPQILNINLGHYNLSTPLLLLLNILLLIKIYEEYTLTKKIAPKHLVYLGLFLCGASFIHFYYLAILGLFNASFVVVWMLGALIKLRMTIPEILRVSTKLGLVHIISLGFCMFLVQWIDGYYDLRAVGFNLYDDPHFKLGIQSIYTARDFQHIRFPIHYDGPLSADMYLGNFSLYGVLGLIVLRFSKWWIPLKTVFDKDKRVLVLLGISSLILFFTALGEVVRWDENSYGILNILNPLFYVHLVSDQVEQFRFVNRFFWIAFWGWSLIIAYIVDVYWQTIQHKVVRGVIVALALLACIDTYDSISYIHWERFVNYFQPEYVEELYPELNDIKFEDYQALLPLPYYTEGAEQKGYQLPGHERTYQAMFQVSIVHKLPILAINASRIPLKHTKQLFSIFTEDRPNQELLDKLSNKPILVLYRKATANEPRHNPSEEPAQSINLKGLDIITKYNMEYVAEGATFSVYKWDVAKLKH
ncbi:MAG: hypothetical protein GY810_23755 [Aureispira sp.]|nr:hypothetical protein [Aureispira sp.]